MDYKLLYAKKREEHQTCLLYKEYARYADTQCILSDAASS